MRRTTWTTYTTRGFSCDVANDQRSAGGVHHWQVRKTRAGWQRRILQSNGSFSAASPVEAITEAEGEAAWARASTS